MTGSGSKRVAIIGAGMAGTVCGARLRRAGWSVTLLDKSGDIGGRLATRRRAGARWNHGAPAVEVRSDAFARLLECLCSAGSARRTARPGGAFAGVPDMRELLRPLTAGLELRLRWRVTELQHRDRTWRLVAEDGRRAGPFDALVCALPAPQGVALLRSSDLAVPEDLARVTFDSRWVLLAGFAEPPGVAGDVRSSVVSSLQRARAAGGRLRETWVVSADAGWSVRHLERDRGDVAARLWSEVQRLTGTTEAAVVDAHRWRFAQALHPLGSSHVWQPDTRLGLIGDWCIGRAAEDAFTSAMALAAAIDGSD